MMLAAWFTLRGSRNLDQCCTMAMYVGVFFCISTLNYLYSTSAAAGATIFARHKLTIGLQVRLVVSKFLIKALKGSWYGISHIFP